MIHLKQQDLMAHGYKLGYYHADLEITFMTVMHFFKHLKFLQEIKHMSWQ